MGKPQRMVKLKDLLSAIEGSPEHEEYEVIISCEITSPEPVDTFETIECEFLEASFDHREKQVNIKIAQREV